LKAELRRRRAEGIEILDYDVETEIDWQIDHLLQLPSRYTPISFWEGQEHYVEIGVEKVDLKHLFSPSAANFFPHTEYGRLG
jgi:hypothetical protein